MALKYFPEAESAVPSSCERVESGSKVTCWELPTRP